MNLSLKRKPRPKVASPEDRMTLTEHLAELRTRIIRSLLAVVIGIIVMLAFYDQVLNFLREPYQALCDRKKGSGLVCELQFIGPLEGFTTRLSICTYGGIVLALPVIMWQIWRFIVPALHSKEKKYAVPFILSSIVLFLMGAVVA
jgi:sec-independent protein translocase protein TatC